MRCSVPVTSTLTDNVDVFSELHFAQTYASASGFVVEPVQRLVADGPVRPAYDDPNSPTFGRRTARDGSSSGPGAARGAAELAADPRRAVDV